MKLNLLLALFAAAALSASAQTPAAKTALTKNDLRKLIENTEWVVTAKTKDDSSHVIFDRNGIITSTIGPWRFYTVEVPNILRVYGHDPRKDRNEVFFQYRVNVAAMIAVFDAPASTRPVVGIPMIKYIGPAPKKSVRPAPKKKK